MPRRQRVVFEALRTQGVSAGARALGLSRILFWVRPKTPGASYRVTIHSGDWTRTGGGSGL